MRRRVPASLVIMLILASAIPVVAEETKPSSIKSSVERAAKKLASQPAQKTRIPPGYLWTGVGLMGAGGLTILSGLTIADEACEEDFSDLDCGAFKAGWIGAGVAEAGVGALLIYLGNKKREPVTNSLQFGKRSVKWHVRF